MDDGHCGLPTDELVPLAERLLEVSGELVRTALELELADGAVVADRVSETPCIFLAGLHRAERVVAERLRRLAKGSLPWPIIDVDKALPWVAERLGLSLAESQSAAVRLALASKVLVITGGPGVGKTTIVKAILRVLGAKGVRLLLCLLGAGSAATGIAELVSLAMMRDGLDSSAARSRIALFDVNGLVITSRIDLAEFQQPFAQDRPPISSFVEAIRVLRPTGIIGVSAVPKLFTREVIEAMASINERPIVFPYSNPTSRSECTAEEAYRWSDGRAIFASGSPFPPVEIAGRRFVPGQGNNVYIFPAMGMALFATEATRVTEEMFIVASGALAGQVTDENLAMGLIYPPQSRILDASLLVAERIAACIFDSGLARAPRPPDVAALVRDRVYRPVYPQ
jgi:malate dehydrogenase (oxaloacetate-decarboxylating)(NADP+)